MGREFLDIFSGWAKEYDDFVEGKDPQYREVFAGYESILQELAERSGQNVLEFGIGTGNLTRRLLRAGKRVFPVEPSAEMRRLARAKLPDDLVIHEGDLQQYPLPDFPLDSIVSSYVFHHLNAEEKAAALKQYAGQLPPGGKVIFADTMFMTGAAYEKKQQQAIANGFMELAADLEREYYPLIPALYQSFRAAGLERISFTQLNEYVWIVEGTRPETPGQKSGK